MPIAPPSTGTTVAVFHVSASETKHEEQVVCVDTKCNKHVVDDEVADKVDFLTQLFSLNLVVANQDFAQSPPVDELYSPTTEESEEHVYVMSDEYGRIFVDYPCSTEIQMAVMCSCKCEKSVPCGWVRACG